MSILKDKSMEVLELPAILELLASFAVSEEAKERCLNLRPTDFLPEALQLMEETTAARELLSMRGSPSMSGIRPVSAALGRTQLGGTLNTTELLGIAGVVRAARIVKAYAPQDGRSDPLQRMFRLLNGNKYLEDRIYGCILSEDEIADNASSELANIRRHMRAAAAKAREMLQRYISSPTYSKFLQDSLITQRSGRFVIPVKAEHKGDVPGLIHDVSSSGATVFIEPMPVVQAGNELRELEGKEKKEIDRILAELSAECDTHRENILQDYGALVALDVIFARAKLSSDMNAAPPKLNNEGIIRFINSRHPLLERSKAVPISVWLGSAFDSLIITGPNTGGKTVTLKTIGLLTLMASCGLHIPAGEGSEAAIMEGIYADIGDEQSIAQSLSTFSSHMKNIVGILSEAGERSLVLFDELGAGTDPVEGAALAVAIIEQARRQGCKIAATTHYAELKMYAMTTSGVENASCEFNVETLSPTYKLLIGIPGKSNAFAISRRLGMPEYIINSAQAQVGTQDSAFEDVLTQLEASRLSMDKERVSAEIARREAEADMSKAAALKALVEKEYERAAEKAKLEARRIVEDARKSADEIMRELSRMRESGITNEQAAAVRQKLNQAEDSVHIKRDSTLEDERFTVAPKPGDEVKIKSSGIPATVIEGPDKNGIMLVQAGIMKVQVPLDGLAPPAKTKKKSESRGVVSVSRNPEPLKMELDLRGQPGDEGVMLLEQFLDAAVMNKLEKVTVIHGKGTGTLRAAVHTALRKHKQVKSFRLGRYGEGESGVTIVEIK